MYSPLKRNPVNKARSASTFRRQAAKTKAHNLRIAGLARGGIRM